MATVTFTRHLQRFFPELEPLEVDATTVRGALDAVEGRHAGILRYLLEDGGALRKHVNIFVDDAMIADRASQSDAIDAGSTVHVMQALSGG